MKNSKTFFCAGIALAIAFAGCTNSSSPSGSTSSTGAAATGETSPAGVGGTTSVPAASSTQPGGHSGGSDGR